MYDSQNSLISNYINPIIGDLKVQEVTPRVVDKYIQTLQKTPAVYTKMHKAKTQYVTNQTIEKIVKLLRCAFKQAVRWELIAKNPFDNVIPVSYTHLDVYKRQHLLCLLSFLPPVNTMPELPSSTHKIPDFSKIKGRQSRP